MNPVELPVAAQATEATATPVAQITRERYGQLARRVKLLSWLSLAGAWWLDPIVGLLIAGVAVREGLETWRGEGCCACG